MTSFASPASAARSSWPVRLHRLGQEPREDLSASTTAEARLAMMWPLAVEAWSFMAAPLPDYSRSAAPVARRPWRVRAAAPK